MVIDYIEIIRNEATLLSYYNSIWIYTYTFIILLIWLKTINKPHNNSWPKVHLILQKLFLLFFLLFRLLTDGRQVLALFEILFGLVMIKIHRAHHLRVLTSTNSGKVRPVHLVIWIGSVRAHMALKATSGPALEDFPVFVLVCSWPASWWLVAF